MAESASARPADPPFWQRIGVPLTLAWLVAYLFLGLGKGFVPAPAHQLALRHAERELEYVITGVFPNNLDLVWFFGPISETMRYWIAGVVGVAFYGWLILAVRVRALSWVGLAVLLLYLPACIVVEVLTIILLMAPGTSPAAFWS